MVLLVAVSLFPEMGVFIRNKVCRVKRDFDFLLGQRKGFRKRLPDCLSVPFSLTLSHFLR